MRISEAAMTQKISSQYLISDAAFSGNTYKYAVSAIRKYGLDKSLISLLNPHNELNTLFECRQIGYIVPSEDGYDDNDEKTVKEHSEKMISALERLIALRQDG
jgi:hypothetical protein